MNKQLIVGVFACLACIVIQSTASAQPTALRVRKNFSQLTTAEKDSIKRGISAMKGRPANDPTSWQFQANIHGMIGPRTSPLHKQCAHGHRPGQFGYFLPWHRGYLYYFERILRDAAGDPSLTLPYWDWPSDPALPVEFRTPATSTNPLYEPARFLNNGSMLNTFALRNGLSTTMRQTNFFRFQDALEGPHGNVHMMVGGRMGGVPTSANDPIFWLHHCNVDRQWDRWLVSLPGRQNPANSRYLNQRFSFADVGGVTVTRSVRNMLFSEDLGYRYDDVFGIAEVVAMNPQDETERPQNVLATSVSISETPGGNSLMFAEKRVKLSLSEGPLPLGTSLIETPGQTAKKIKVRIEGIRFKESPVYAYGVFLNLPKDEKNEQRMAPHFVGTLDFFSATQDHANAHQQPAVAETVQDGFKKFNQTIDLTEAIEKLVKAEKWDPAKIEIALVPLAPIPPQESELEAVTAFNKSATDANISYEKIEVISEP